MLTPERDTKSAEKTSREKCQLRRLTLNDILQITGLSKSQVLKKAKEKGSFASKTPGGRNVWPVDTPENREKIHLTWGKDQHGVQKRKGGPAQNFHRSVVRFGKLLASVLRNIDSASDLQRQRILKDAALLTCFSNRIKFQIEMAELETGLSNCTSVAHKSELLGQFVKKLFSSVPTHMLLSQPDRDVERGELISDRMNADAKKFDLRSEDFRALVHCLCDYAKEIVLGRSEAE